MNPIPISERPVEAQVKMNPQKWLSTKIKYDDELLYNDIMSDISHKIYHWIRETDDLIIHEEYQVLHQQIIELYLPFVEKKYK